MNNAQLATIAGIALSYLQITFLPPNALAEESRAAVATPQKDYSAGWLQKTLLTQNKPIDQTQTGESTENSGFTLNLDNPELEAKPDSGGGSSNLSFGGAVDMRLSIPKSAETVEPASLNIHVAELFLTTNIGDNVSILMEQLLVTSPLGDTLGQDHGFVYAIFSNLPGLPENISVKMGRTRFRYGIDAKLDAPANTLLSPVYKTLGVITDKGVEISGYYGPVEWSLGIMNGVDVVEKSFITTDGTTAQAEVQARNGSKPLVARVSVEAADFLSVGISGFSGRSYPVLSSSMGAGHSMVFNALADTSQFIYKNRTAVDALLRLGSKWRLSGEWSVGEDIAGSDKFNLSSYFVRADYQIVPQVLSTQLQYEYFDDGREGSQAMADDSGNIGLGLQYHFTPQSWLRASWLQSDKFLGRTTNDTSNYVAVLQTFLAF